MITFEVKFKKKNLNFFYNIFFNFYKNNVKNKKKNKKIFPYKPHYKRGFRGW